MISFSADVAVGSLTTLLTMVICHALRLVSTLPPLTTKHPGKGRTTNRPTTTTDAELTLGADDDSRPQNRREPKATNGEE